MKLYYILGILAMLVLAGCTAQTAEPQATDNNAADAPAQVPTAEAPSLEVPPEAPAEVPGDEGAAPAEEDEAPAVASGTEILVTATGFDPEEVTVKVGDSVEIRSAQGLHQLIISGDKSGAIDQGVRLEEGASYTLVPEKAENIRLYDVISKKDCQVIVEE
ncbi:TPA: hypothetical protein HA361_01355 [Candidatus Woesearchaeota archaeon]|nr:hypothetical protein [Candidatus Woesearchaeota archaeon]